MSNSESDVTEKSIDFGTVLLEARKTHNYTVGEISEHLKIPAHVIAAIESNDLDVLPPPTFTQGYIRTYAKFLEISEEAVLERYNQAVPRDNTSKLKPRSRLPGEASSQSPLFKTMTMLLIVAGLAAIIYGSIQYYQEKADVMESERETKEHSFTGNSLNSPGSQSLGIKTSTSITADQPDSQEDVTTESEEPIGQAETAVSATVSETAAEAEESNTANEPLSDSSVLKFFAENGSWMEVRDASNARLFYNMVPKGGSKILQGQAPFRISLGNAKTTRVTINELEVDMTKYIRANNTAKFTVSTEDQNVIFH